MGGCCGSLVVSINLSDSAERMIATRDIEPVMVLDAARCRSSDSPQRRFLREESQSQAIGQQLTSDLILVFVASDFSIPG